MTLNRIVIWMQDRTSHQGTELLYTIQQQQAIISSRIFELLRIIYRKVSTKTPVYYILNMTMIGQSGEMTHKTTSVSFLFRQTRQTCDLFHFPFL